MRFSTLACVLASSLLGVLWNGPARADSPRELLEHGLEQFSAGDYSAALDTFSQIDEDADPQIKAELLHNRAAAQFKLGRIDDARELWVRAAGLKDERFESAARYNLGNCDYADALEAMKAKNVQGALELLDRALGQYRDALTLDPARADARANLELAAQLKKQIEEKSQKQPQSQPSQDQKNKQDKDQNKQQQSSSQPSSQPSDSQKDKQQKQDDSKDQQKQQDSKQDRQPPDTQPSPQSQPSQPQPSKAENDDQQDKEPQPAVQIEMTRKQAERLLQMIRDAERQRRAALRAREASKQKPVEKDW